MLDYECATKKNVRERWLRALFEFTDVGFQQGVWLEGTYPDISGSYTEALCRYYDDLDLNEGYDSFVKEGFATTEEASIVKQFHDALNNYIGNVTKEDFTDLAVLSDPEWLNITRLGKSVWQALKSVITDNEEEVLMQELENKY